MLTGTGPRAMGYGCKGTRLWMVSKGRQPRVAAVGQRGPETRSPPRPRERNHTPTAVVRIDEGPGFAVWRTDTVYKETAATGNRYATAAHLQNPMKKASSNESWEVEREGENTFTPLPEGDSEKYRRDNDKLCYSAILVT